MALTFKITNGDVVLNTSSGKPVMLGNDLNENIASKAKDKASQDLGGALSINRIRSGAGAGISELVGVMQEVGFISTKVLLQRQITNMFSSLIRLQSIRSGVRPNNERFSNITLFKITQNPYNGTLYNFRLDISTVGGGTIVKSGTIVG